MRTIALATTTILLLAACSSATSGTTTTEESPTTTMVEATTTAPGVATTVEETTTTSAEVTTTTVSDVVEISITYANGEVAGGGRVEVPLGEPVELTVVSDVADEGHLHGYDIFIDLEPGTEGVIEFVADIPGIFEFELESSGVLLADLEVAP